MKLTDNKKAHQILADRGLIDVNNLKESQHDYYTTKSFKPKQSTFSYW
jgi:hypothetical protein